MKRIDFMNESKLVKILNNSTLAKSTFLLAEAADSISTYIGIKYYDMFEANPFVKPVLDSMSLENGLVLHTAATLAVTGLIAEGTNKYCELKATKEKLGNLLYYGVGVGIAGRAAINVLEILQA